MPFPAAVVPGRCRLYRVFPAAIAATVLAGCGSQAARPADGPEQTNIVVAAVPAEGAAGLFIAQEQGLFAKAGLHVTITATENPPADIPAMLHGTVDVLSGQYTTYIAADAAGAARMRILAAGYALGPHVQEIMTGPRSLIKSPAQLKGKTIAVNAPDSVTTDLLYTALSPYGITPAQVHVAVIAFPVMGAALAAGRVDAIYEVEPYVTEAAEKYGDTELADIDAGASQDFPVNGYGALASWVAAHPRAARAFAHAIEQGNAIAATDITARQRAVQTALHLSPQVVAVMAAGRFPTALDPVQIQRAADLMLRYGQLRRPFAVASITGP
jgi:NitT/TauT family transport system substrate-binding protein